MSRRRNSPQCRRRRVRLCNNWTLRNLAVDGKKLMPRFFQLRGSRGQAAAAAVVTDAELQADVKIIG